MDDEVVELDAGESFSQYAHRLNGVEPKLASAITRLACAMHMLGTPIWVVEGVRSLERQRSLYEQGRTKPGGIVTNVTGTNVELATHCIQKDGFGHAVDVAFAGPQPWDGGHPWAVMGAMGKLLKLKWGGDWKVKLGDYGHFEI